MTTTWQILDAVRLTSNGLIKKLVYKCEVQLEDIICIQKGKVICFATDTVYGVAGSGNLGIGTLVTPMFLADSVNLSEIERKSIIVLSFLTSVYVKQEMSIVTVLCGTGHATGSSTAAVTTYVRGGTPNQIKRSINLYLATAMGFVCDGAKMSCTYKVSFAAMNGMIAGKMVMDDNSYCDGYGIGKDDVDMTIKNLGKLNNDILNSANKGIIELI